MTHDDRDRQINQYMSDSEERMTVLRQIYDTLPHEKKTLLEHLLKKLIVCTHLFGELLPSARMNIFMLDFNEYRKTHAKEWSDRLENLSPEVMDAFSGPNIPMFLSHAYLAVRKWNRGRLYAPKHPALAGRSRYYPVPLDLPEESAPRLARLVEMANELLPSAEHPKATQNGRL